MPTWSAIEQLVTEIEDLQRGKVLALARRLRPGLTLEDVRNPHDFPELDDRDWQYEDGVLTGIESVLFALRALKDELDKKQREAPPKKQAPAAPARVPTPREPDEDLLSFHRLFGGVKPLDRSRA